MKPIPRISEAEWEVMEVLWKDSPQIAAEVHARLKDRSQWKSNTVRTLIARLVQKGILRHEADGNRYLYSPAVTREQCVETVGQSFLDKVFGGAVEPLLLHFASRARLTRQEADQLRQILERKDT